MMKDASWVVSTWFAPGTSQPSQVTRPVTQEIWTSSGHPIRLIEESLVSCLREMEEDKKCLNQDA